MKIQVEFLSGGLIFPEVEGFIKGIIERHAEKAMAVLPFENDFIIFSVTFSEADEIKAFAQKTDLIKIDINPKYFENANPKREETIEQLIYIIYHEMHHSCRGYVGSLPAGQEHILINSIISEGLADYFVRELYPSEHVLEKTNFNLAEIKDWINRVGEVMWNKESDNDSWLYGGKGKPEMLGYKIGRYIMEKIKEKNPDLDLIELVKAPPEKIIKLSGIDFGNI
jgi:hypothetical protein